MVVLGVMVGGALGALARYAVGLLLRSSLVGAAGVAFPLGTLVVNVLGSFLLAFVGGVALRGVISPRALVSIGTGFLGAFTTFSTFALESDTLLREGLPWWATLSVAGNLVLGYLAILAGRGLAARLAGG